MKKEDKSAIISQLESTISEYAHFYLADIAGLNAAQTSELRRVCYKQDVKLVVVKNTLLKKEIEEIKQSMQVKTFRYFLSRVKTHINNFLKDNK